MHGNVHMELSFPLDKKKVKQQYVLGIAWWLGSKDTACNAGAAVDVGLISGLEDPLEEGMATHSSILAWGIHGQRSLGGYSS